MVNQTITIQSPAKINLMLRVLGRRPDGYHELQTVFKILNWGDHMHFTCNDFGGEAEIQISGFAGLAIEDNLIYQAAKLLKPYVISPCKVTIDVEKYIPQGGGLGGGSSNAATTLKVLNNCLGCDLDQKQLMQLGLKLGADVPVFILSKDALATGVGERLKPIELPEQHILLMFPECSVPTADVFKNDMLERSQMAVTENEAFQKDAWINACLPVVLSMYPKIKRLYEIMSTNYKVYLSGTGSTLYILFDELDLAEKAKKKALAHCKCQLI